MFIYNEFHCFFTASFKFGEVRLSVCVSRSYLFSTNVFDILSYISVLLYPVSIIFFDKMSQLVLKARFSVHICFRRRAWAHGMLSFKDCRCFDFLRRLAWHSVSFLNNVSKVHPWEILLLLCLRNLHSCLINWNRISLMDGLDLLWL